jgi:hypothetical protein
MRRRNSQANGTRQDGPLELADVFRGGQGDGDITLSLDA